MWSLKAGFSNLSNEDDICQASSAHLNDGRPTAVSTLSPVSPQGPPALGILAPMFVPMNEGRLGPYPNPKGDLPDRPQKVTKADRLC